MTPTESQSGPTNGGDEASPVTADAPRDKEDRSVASRRAGKGAQESASRASTRAKAPNRSPPVNAMQATRRHRRERRETGPPAPGAEAGTAAPATQDPTSAPRRPSRTEPSPGNASSDPWTVPQSVRDRFVQDGHRFFFPDGAPAFKDLGRRLTTPSENTHVVHSLIEIAYSRGWSEITVSGTERFRQEAWRLARVAGLSVRGYRPTDPEQAQLVRALARGLAMRSNERLDTTSAKDPADPDRAPAGAPAPSAASAAPTAAGNAPRERIVGRLLDHGRDAYRHDPQEEMSYFVRVQTREGNREIWGKDLERAMTKSLTQPQIGDEIALQKTGREVVTVKRQERDAEGQLKEKSVETHRNQWVIEKSSFFAERAAAAQLFRDEAIGPREAVRQHPELAGTYLNLRAAELASRGLRDPQDQRRFVAQVRGALADHVERGEPLQPVRLRERVLHKGEKDRASLTRE